jgi:hypothetical protein
MFFLEKLVVAQLVKIFPKNHSLKIFSAIMDAYETSGYSLVWPILTL